MSARDMIADFVRKRAIPCPSDVDPDAIYFDNGHARELVDALAAAGYRLIGTGELDRETIERCAAFVADAPSDLPRHKLSVALRSLQGGEDGQ